VNKICAKIKKIQNADSVNLISVEYKGIELAIMSLGLDRKLEKNQKVELLIKPICITVAKNFDGQISYLNSFKSKIIKIDKGILVSVVTLDFKGVFLQSIMASPLIQKMNLKVNEEVDTFVKSSHISISRFLDE